jgi:hypothetical protein
MATILSNTKKHAADADGACGGWTQNAIINISLRSFLSQKYTTSDQS